ncbi:hypothetical protein QGN32_23085 [Mycolicibacterium sp. ND9-15]|uniref:hypothetical protein n=1 Tax=Mycolicibacterium sp. ND9-15 TaxID=3042320 RepID=UPI002DDC8785|nr:hypothetical protein [Mycolicibacterium sp. ND9-15]WSE56183.1 hypothetical protein QGN32_23085 [Mycolicibacterium sp. ND9-15]
MEVAPRAFVAENGHVMTRLSATKWGGGEGLEILDYSGPGTVEVSDEKLAEAQRASEVEAELRREAGTA